MQEAAHDRPEVGLPLAAELLEDLAGVGRQPDHDPGLHRLVRVQGLPSHVVHATRLG